MEVSQRGKYGSRPIRPLSENTILKIAAGEVIERPASVVKELVENSIDAEATRIEVRIAQGGTGFISVTDDGCGIRPSEATLAFSRHATSKIESIEDLWDVDSLGFRGEALASIGAVSHADLLTHASDESSGIRVKCEGGKIFEPEPHGSPPGTTIEISKLFYNVPARRKFLRSPNTEASHIDSAIRRLALVHIGRSFLLEKDGEIVLNLSRTKDLRERVRQLYGSEISKSLVPFEGREGPFRIYGLVSNSHVSFSRPQEIWFFVNRRPVRDRMMQAAVMEGYRTALMERRYPFVVAHVEVPSKKVDVNVHPTKAEVRFSDTQPIFRLISSAISNVLRAPDTANEGLSNRTRFPAEERTSPASLSLGFSAKTEWSNARTPAETYASNPAQENGRFGSLEYLGTIDNTYLVCRAIDALVVLDQHAAHERVLFEQLKCHFEKKNAEIQNLLVPITLEVNASREDALMKSADFLQRIGFIIEPFGSHTFVIKGVPSALGNHDPRPLLLDLADAKAVEEGTGEWNDRIESVLSQVACHSAVRAHDRLGSAEILSLLSQMDKTDLASNCPHGRPTFVRFSLGELEHLFRRK